MMETGQLLTVDRCYLHIIDLQESLMRQIYERERVTRISLMMFKFAQIVGMPIIANTQYKKGLGPYVDELEAMMADIPRPDKVEFSAYKNGETLTLVDELPASVDNVILVGVETHICIYQTAVGAIARGKTPWIISDGVSSRRPEHHRDGLDRLAGLGANIGPAEMLIYELLGKAGTPEFKKVLPLIVEQG